jgi:acyl-coenzyme A thioesterase PaaI-like protein
MSEKPLQQFVVPFGRTCYGCGSENERGFRIQSFLEGEEVVCTWRPEAHHIAGPGFINGGVIATLIDCHTGAAATAAGYRGEGREPGTAPQLTYVTASLHVNYLRPTPAGVPLTLRARAGEVQGRRVVVACSLFADGVETANGESVFVRVPEDEAKPG